MGRLHRLFHQTGFIAALLCAIRVYGDPNAVRGVYSEWMTSFLSYHVTMLLFWVYEGMILITFNVAQASLSTNPAPFVRPVFVSFGLLTLLVVETCLLLWAFVTSSAVVVYGVFLFWLAFAEVIIVGTFDYGIYTLNRVTRRVTASTSNNDVSHGGRGKVTHALDRLKRMGLFVNIFTLVGIVFQIILGVRSIDDGDREGRDPDNFDPAEGAFMWLQATALTIMLWYSYLPLQLAWKRLDAEPPAVAFAANNAAGTTNRDAEPQRPSTHDASEDGGC